MLGPGQCLNCHDHDKEKDWYSSKELLEVVRLFPDKGKNAGHVNSLNQLESPKSDAFAKAIGQADKYSANGACVRCHATVFNGDANAGVSCESCHGPASAYLTPHQVKGWYDTAVTQYGMTRLVGNIQGWTQQCTNCHVMDDDRLIKAGTPSGDDFDLSKRYQPVSLHFKKNIHARAGRRDCEERDGGHHLPPSSRFRASAARRAGDDACRQRRCRPLPRRAAAGARRAANN